MHEIGNLRGRVNRDTDLAKKAIKGFRQISEEVCICVFVYTYVPVVIIARKFSSTSCLQLYPHIILCTKSPS